MESPASREGPVCRFGQIRSMIWVSIALTSYAMVIERGAMETIRVSSKFQIVIPRRVRESLRIRPGQRIQVLLYDNRIEFILLKPIKQMRGFLKGIDTHVDRDRDRV
jgi:AbrB family looped-hinge helix DNA binding protein